VIETSEVFQLRIIDTPARASILTDEAQRDENGGFDYAKYFVELRDRELPDVSCLESDLMK